MQRGTKKIYAIESGYGLLDWKLRNDTRVVVMERTNALHIELPEKIDIVTIDVGWTKQEKIIPKALKLLQDGGQIISLIKPHYEAPKEFLQKGQLRENKIEEVLAKVKDDISQFAKIEKLIESPILGKSGKNKEFLALIVKK